MCIIIFSYITVKPLFAQLIGLLFEVKHGHCFRVGLFCPPHSAEKFSMSWPEREADPTLHPPSVA